MMKFTIGIFVIFYLSAFTQVQAGPLTVRCSGQRTWGDQTVKIQIEIVLPDKRDLVVSIYSPGNQKIEIPDTTPVGIGTIQINEQLGDAKSSHRHQFIVTRLPDGNNSLVGFYLVKSYVNVIRADLWKKEKTFLYFDSYNNEVISGTCQ